MVLYLVFVGTESIHVSPSLSLSSIFHVPDVQINLVYDSHLTKSLNCSVTFFPTYCVFQYSMIRQTLGRGHEQRLYFLDATSHIVSPV